MVEILVVVVILGIMSAVAIPKFLTSQALGELDSDMVRLGQVMELGRRKAWLTGYMHYLVLDLTTNSWTLYRESGANTTFNAGTDIPVLTDSLSKRSRFGSSFTIGTNISTSTYSAPTSGFTDAAPSATGPARGSNAETCLDGTGTQANWAIVSFCRGGTSPIESGALYISSNRTSSRAYALVYNPSISLHLLRFAWNGSAWSDN